MEELTKEGVILRLNGLEKLFVGEEELPCKDQGCLVPYSFFDKTKQVQCKLSTTQGVQNHQLEFPQAELFLDPIVDLERINTGLLEVISFNCSAKLSNSYSQVRMTGGDVNV